VHRPELDTGLLSSVNKPCMRPTERPHESNMTVLHGDTMARHRTASRTRHDTATFGSLDFDLGDGDLSVPSSPPPSLNRAGLHRHHNTRSPSPPAL
jgi:hypothetical protein